MEKEFKLSDKIVDWSLSIKDVKEFIKKIKEIDFNSGYIDYDDFMIKWNEEVCEKIDKLAGDELL